MKVAALLSEKITLPNSLQEQIYQAFLNWMNWLSDSAYKKDMYVISLLKAHGPTCKNKLQQSLSDIINPYIQSQFPDHRVNVKISIANTTKINGKVDAEWVLNNYEYLTNTLLLVIPAETFKNIDKHADGIAVHWTSVAMHEITHLIQGASSQWKSVDTANFRGAKPNTKDVDYYSLKPEIEGHAQQTVSKLISYAEKHDDPVQFIKTTVLPKVIAFDPQLLGTQSTHRLFMVNMTGDTIVAKKARKLYYKRLYQKLENYIQQK